MEGLYGPIQQNQYEYFRLLPATITFESLSLASSNFMRVLFIRFWSVAIALSDIPT